MRCSEILPAGSWDRSRECDVFSADYEGRHRRRMMLDLRSGERMLLDLEHARLLRAGDGLLLEDGRVVRVEAQEEDLLEVTGHDTLHLLRMAWHLGNRHLPAMIEEKRILIRNDHVIADMVRGLGGHIHAVRAPFDPETGAYSSGHAHSHNHGETHAHSHEHEHHHGDGHHHHH